MAKIALTIVLISMIMGLSIQSVVGDVAVSAPTTADVKAAAESVSAAAGPTKDGAKEKSSSWVDWTKNEISGIEGRIESLFSSSSSSAPAPAPATAKKV